MRESPTYSSNLNSMNGDVQTSFDYDSNFHSKIRAKVPSYDTGEFRQGQESTQQSYVKSLNRKTHKKAWVTKSEPIVHRSLSCSKYEKRKSDDPAFPYRSQSTWLVNMEDSD